MSKIVNKKAQIGRILTSVPVLLGVIFFIALFLGWTYLISSGKNKINAYSYVSDSKSFLLGETELVVDGKISKILVFDALSEYSAGSNIDFAKFQIPLEKYLIKYGIDNTCVYIFDNSNDLDQNSVFRARYYVKDGNKMIRVSDLQGFTKEILQFNLKYPEDVERVTFAGGINLINYNQNYEKYTEKLSYTFDGKEFDFEYYFGKCLGGES